MARSTRMLVLPTSHEHAAEGRAALVNAHVVVVLLQGFNEHLLRLGHRHGRGRLVLTGQPAMVGSGSSTC